MKVKTQIVKMPEYEFSFEINDEERLYLIAALDNLHKRLPSGTTPLVIKEFTTALRAVAPVHRFHEFDSRDLDGG